MTKVEILELYIRDLESKVGISPARNNRIAMLKDELKQALNLQNVSNNEVAVCEIEGCNREVLSDSTMCSHHFAVSLDSQTDC